MRALKRIYWTRLTLRLTLTALVVWLFVSAVLALMPSANVSAGAGASSVTEVIRGMVDGVVAAALFHHIGQHSRRERHSWTATPGLIRSELAINSL